MSRGQTHIQTSAVLTYMRLFFPLTMISTLEGVHSGITLRRVVFASTDCEPTCNCCMVAWTATSYAEALHGHCTLFPARKPWRTFTGAHLQPERVRHRLKHPNRRCIGECNSAANVRCSTESGTSSQRVTRRTLGLFAAAVTLGVSSFPDIKGAYQAMQSEILPCLWNSDSSVSSSQQLQQL